MSIDQYTEVINRVTSNLLSSSKNFQRAYSGSKTKKDFKEIKNTGLSELSKNLVDKEGNPFTKDLLEDDKKVYEEYNEKGEGIGDPIQVPDLEKILSISNNGMALTISYAMSVEIDKLLEEISKLESRVESLESDVKNLQSENKSLNSRVTELENKVKSLPK